VVVVEAVERFGWQPLPNPPRGEDDVFELWVLRDLARDLGAVRRSGRRLVATRAGRALAGDAAALWRAVAGRLGGGHDFGAIVTEPLRVLGVLGLSREGGDGRARRVALTSVGHATALEACALAPPVPGPTRSADARRPRRACAAPEADLRAGAVAGGRRTDLEPLGSVVLPGPGERLRR
jgi:hypothetical protein